MSPLPPRGVPGVADLDPIDLGDDVVEPRAPRDGARRQLPDHPGEHVTGTLAVECVGDVDPRLPRFRDEGEPELPEPAVRGRGREPVLMPGAKRLEPDAVPLECDGSHWDHLRPRCDLIIPSRRAETLRRRRDSAPHRPRSRGPKASAPRPAVPPTHRGS